MTAGCFAIVGNPLIAFEGLGCSFDDVDVAVRATFECQESAFADDPDVLGSFVGHFKFFSDYTLFYIKNSRVFWLLHYVLF